MVFELLATIRKESYSQHIHTDGRFPGSSGLISHNHLIIVGKRRLPLKEESLCSQNVIDVVSAATFAMQHNSVAAEMLGFAKNTFLKKIGEIIENS